MKPLLLPLLAIAVSAQSQPIPCGSPPAIAANPVSSGGTSAFAAQIRRRPPAVQPSFSCRCGLVGASSLTAQSNSQEVLILNGLAGSFRFDHVLLRETTRFLSDSAASLVVGVGRPTLGPDVVSPFRLKSDSAPYSFWYERPTPPQLTGAYDLVLNFKASAPLGDGAVSNFSSGTVTWEVCGYNAPPAP
jgi:hypothetical protein